MNLLLLETDAGLLRDFERAAARRGHALEIVVTAADALAVFSRAACPIIAARRELLGPDPASFRHAIDALPGGPEAVLLVSLSVAETVGLGDLLDAGASDFILLPTDETRIDARLRIAERIVAERGRRLEFAAAAATHEGRLSLVLQNAPVNLFAFDREGVITLSEGMGLEALGLAPGELVGRSLFEMFKDDPDTVAKLRAVLAGERPSGGRDFGGRHFESAYMPVRNEVGTIVGAVGVALDVTDRKRAEESARNTEESFRSLIESSPEGIIVHRDWRILYVNRRFATLLGYGDPGELVGRSAVDLMPPEEREIAMGRVRKVMAEGGASPPREVRLLRRDGSIQLTEIAGGRVMYDGEPSTLAVVRDVTERNALQARLLAADRMASIGTLAAGVAHEINNPLTYVLGNLELAIAEIDGLQLGARGDPAHRMLLEALKGADRVRKIVRDLKTFTRGEEDTFSAVDVRTCIEASISLAWNEIRHRARLVKEFSDVPPVHANESRLGQVFLNLLVNSAQAIPEGMADRNEIRIATRLLDPGHIEVEVRDSGAGIPPEHLPRIFDPFFTTKPIGVGTGLGLFLCQKIVRSIGGEVSVESLVGQGTVFRVVLPTATAHLRPPPSAPPVDASVRRGARILIVDDEETICTVLTQLLGRDHMVEAVTRAQEALARIAGGARFDVILCDLMMPVMTGMELHAELARLAPDQARRMIFITGGAFTPDASRFLEQIANPYLEKPFESDRLRAMIAECLAREANHGTR